jgi:hypothetical protein
VLAARSHAVGDPCPASRPRRDAHADRGTGPLPRRTPSVRVPAHRCRASSQPGTGSPRCPAAPARIRPRHSTARDLHLRRAPR